ncbi:MAG TPA: prephenate dehydratase domain-containing protein [Polyangiaceae bacterium]|nr:prephenate dehydratase domain-containing protein [Polyangiaceae bacterium]
MVDRGRQVSELRERIAGLDQEIRERLEQRARLSHEIRGLHEAEPATDLSDREWLEKIVASSTGDMPEESLRAIFREIRAAGRAIEHPVRVAVVGPEGSFSHQSTLEVFGATAQLIECGTVADALNEVSRGRAAYAVFPFESSAEGIVQPSLLALAETNLVLVGERFTQARYHLMSTTNDIGALEKVYMTAAGHAACERFLEKELTRVGIIDVRSPAVAVELAREAPTNAAIVPERVGTAGGLSIVRENIGDVPDLQLRYGIAAARPAARSGRDVSCILFSTDESPSALYDVLRHLGERGITLRKLQSLPVRGDGIEYLYFAEIGGHASDRSVVTAFEQVKRSVRYFKLLGSFPAAS